VIAAGVVPSAMELMDRAIVAAVERFAHAGYPTDAEAVLIVEVDGTEGAVRAQASVVEDAARSHDVRTIRAATEPAERATLWKGRKSAFGSLGQIAPHYYLHDVVVPRTRLAEALGGFYAIGRRHELGVSCLAHAGDGNLHPHLHFDQREGGALERVLAASEEIVRLAVDLGGTLSGEHGVGLEKRDFLPLVFSADDLAAQACVRTAFDPELRMNPHKVLPDGARCPELGAAAAGPGEGAWT
jgi:glycolate oxidase